MEVYKKKTPSYQKTTPQDQQLAQFVLGKAAALVRAPQDTLHRAAEFAYADVSASGKTLSTSAEISAQSAASYAAKACAGATRRVNDAVGTSAIRLEQPFERCFHDANTHIHHAASSNLRCMEAAKLMLGF